MRPSLVWGLSLSIFVLSSGASAQYEDERARMHFQAGFSYYEAGDYDDALREFERAYEMSQRSELFYNYALCYQQLGDFRNAAHYMERFLTEVQDVENRENLERRLEYLRSRIPEQEAQEEAERAAREAEERRRREEQARLEAEQARRAAAPPPGPNVGAITSFSAGGVGAAMFAVFGGLALGERNSVESGCFETSTCTDGDVSTMDSYAIVADVGLGVGVVGAGLGVMFLLLERSERGEEEREGGAEVSVLPNVDPVTGAVGAQLRGRF